MLQGDLNFIELVKKGDINSVRLLLGRNDFDVNVQDNNGGTTALMWACYNNEIDIR